MKCLLFVTFLQNELIRKDEIIKSLLETQTSILETVSKPSVEEEKDDIHWKHIYTLETLV